MNGQFIFKNKFCKDYQNKDEFDNYLFTSLDIKEIFILSSIKIISLNIIQNLLDFINTPHPNAPRINALFPRFHICLFYQILKFILSSIKI